MCGLLLPPIFFWNAMEEKHKGERSALAGEQRGQLCKESNKDSFEIQL